MRYYHCINCGYHGDFKYDRQKNIKCHICDYDDLTNLEVEEWNEYGKKRNAYQNEEKFYIERRKDKNYNKKDDI